MHLSAQTAPALQSAPGAPDFLCLDGAFRSPDAVHAAMHEVLVADLFEPPLEPGARKHKVHNFEVEGTHTYVAGGYRVHNQSILSFIKPGELVNIVEIRTNAEGTPDFAVVQIPGKNIEFEYTLGSGGTSAIVEATYSDGAGNLYYTRKMRAPDGSEVTLKSELIKGQGQGGTIAESLTPFLTRAFLDEDASVLEQVAADAIISTVLFNLGEVIGGTIGRGLLDVGQMSLKTQIETAAQVSFEDFGGELIYNGAEAVISLVNQLVLAEVYEAIEVDGVPGAILNSVLSAGITELLGNGFEWLFDLDATQNFLSAAGLNTASIKALAAHEFGGLPSANDPGGAAGGWTGLVISAVLREVLPPLESIEGQVVQTLTTAALSTFGVFQSLGFMAGPAGVVFGYFAGKIADLIFDEDPEAWSAVEFDVATGEFVIDRTWSHDGGDEDLSTALANAYIQGMNGFVEAMGAKNHNFAELAGWTFGHYEEFIKNEGKSGKTFDDFEDAYIEAFVKDLAKAEVVDGNLTALRAFNAIDVPAMTESYEVWTFFFEAKKAHATLDEYEGWTFREVFEDRVDKAMFGGGILSETVRQIFFDGGELSPEDQARLVASSTVDEATRTKIEAVLADTSWTTFDEFRAVSGAPEKLYDKDEILSHVGSRLQIASDYYMYLENRDAIEAIIASAPESAFAAGWVSTLMMAAEMDLDKAIRWNAGGEDNRLVSADGNDTIKGGDGADYIHGFGGDDLLYGENGNDTLIGGIGNDTLIGGKGDDTYLFRRLDGTATIDEGGLANGNDTVRFEGYSLAEAIFSRDPAAGDNLIVTFEGTGDHVLMRGAIAPSWSLGRQIERFEFDDGVVLAESDLAARIEADAPRAAITTVQGTSGDDIIAATSGIDLLRGLDGSDTYVFGYGDGQDIIDDVGSGDTDVLRIEDYSSKQATFRRDRLDLNDLVITFEGTADMVRLMNGTLDGGGWTSSLSQIERIEFVADGTVLEGDSLLDRILADQISAGDDDILGFSQRDDVIDAGRGDDRVDAGGGNDTLIGGEGDDVLIGGAGDDLYIFRAGDGRDWMHDDGFQSNDTLRIEGHSSDETRIVFAHDYGNRSDILISFASFEDGLHLEGATLNATGGYDQSGRIERIEFADDGLVLEGEALLDRMLADQSTVRDDIVYGFSKRDDVIDAGSGDDIIDGEGGSDTLIAGLGNDLLIGGADGDLYVFRVGDGQDRIHDGGWDGLDVLRVEGYASTEAKIVFGHSYTERGNIYITFEGSDDRITLLEATLNGTGGYDGIDTIERIEFATDGLVLEGEAILERMLADQVTSGDDLLMGYDRRHDLLDAGAGNDRIEGHGGDDTLIGGEGDDLLIGGHGDDLYVFRAGDGHDRIHDIYAGFDTLRVEGYASTEAKIVFGHSYTERGNIYITFEGSDDRITLLEATLGGTGSYDLDRIERIEFADDGMVLEGEAILERMLVDQVTDGNDLLMGYDHRDDVLDAGAGNDRIEGDGGDDTLIGGEGDDLLIGHHGSDTYVYRFGDGHDVIDDTGGNGVDVLRIEGIPEAWAKFEASGADVLITFDSGGSVRLSRTMRFENGGHDSIDRIERVEFEDGTVLEWDDIIARILLDRATAGDDIITGFNGRDDTLDGGAGNDTLDGGTGNDRLFGGLGDDRLIGGDGVDWFDGGDGIDTLDLIGTVFGYVVNLKTNSIFFGEGQTETVLNVERIFTGAGADVLTGTIGANFLSGGAGADLYHFEAGDGQDTIHDQGDGAIDELRIEGYTFDQVRILRDRSDLNDLLVTFLNSTDSIRLVDAVSETVGTAGASVIERIAFADGTVLEGDALEGRLIADQATDGDDDILGIDGRADTIDGGSGDDLIDGSDGNDVLRGGAGSDTLIGGTGADDLSGGIGDDRLEGGTGDDIYRLALGDGADVIDDETGSNDRIVFAAGIALASMVGTAADADGDGEDDLLLTYGDGADSVLIVDALGSPADATATTVEWFELADGTVLDWEAFKAEVYAAPAVDETIIGTSGNDTLLGGLGNDTLHGKDGADTYVFRAGDGQDVVEDQGYFDTDVLRIEGYTSEQATILFDRSDVNDILVTFAGTTDSIRLVDSTRNGSGYFDETDRVERIEFADGTVLEGESLQDRMIADQITDGDDDVMGFDQRAEVIDAGAGDDRIDGRSGNDTIVAGLGNDFLVGGTGSDTFVFRAGDGQDVIHDQGYGSTDVLRIEGYTVAETHFARDPSDANDLLVTFTGSTDTIRLVDATVNASGYFDGNDRIERFEFADGTVFDAQSLLDRMLAAQITDGDDDVQGYDQRADTIDAGRGDDVMRGLGGNDILIAGLGNDTLIGGQGSDTFIFWMGDGQDVIHDQGYGSTDVLRIEGYDLADITFARAPGDTNDALITFAGSTDSIRLIDALDNSSGYFDSNDRIEMVQIGTSAQQSLMDFFV